MKKRKKKEKRRGYWHLAIFLGIIWIIGLIYFYVYLDWQIDKKVYSYYELVYAAGDAEQMSDFFLNFYETWKKKV